MSKPISPSIFASIAIQAGNKDKVNFLSTNVGKFGSEGIVTKDMQDGNKNKPIAHFLGATALINSARVNPTLRTNTIVKAQEFILGINDEEFSVFLDNYTDSMKIAKREIKISEDNKRDISHIDVDSEFLIKPTLGENYTQIATKIWNFAKEANSKGFIKDFKSIQDELSTSGISKKFLNLIDLNLNRKNQEAFREFYQEFTQEKGKFLSENDMLLEGKISSINIVSDIYGLTKNKSNIELIAKVLNGTDDDINESVKNDILKLKDSMQLKCYAIDKNYLNVGFDAQGNVLSYENLSMPEQNTGVWFKRDGHNISAVAKEYRDLANLIWKAKDYKDMEDKEGFLNKLQSSIEFLHSPKHKDNIEKILKFYEKDKQLTKDFKKLVETGNLKASNFDTSTILDNTTHIEEFKRAKALENIMDTLLSKEFVKNKIGSLLSFKRNDQSGNNRYIGVAGAIQLDSFKNRVGKKESYLDLNYPMTVLNENDDEIFSKSLILQGASIPVKVNKNDKNIITSIEVKENSLDEVLQGVKLKNFSKERKLFDVINKLLKGKKYERDEEGEIKLDKDSKPILIDLQSSEIKKLLNWGGKYKDENDHKGLLAIAKLYKDSSKKNIANTLEDLQSRLDNAYQNGGITAIADEFEKIRGESKDFIRDNYHKGDDLDTKHLNMIVKFYDAMKTSQDSINRVSYVVNKFINARKTYKDTNISEDNKKEIIENNKSNFYKIVAKECFIFNKALDKTNNKFKEAFKENATYHLPQRVAEGIAWSAYSKYITPISKQGNIISTSTLPKEYNSFIGYETIKDKKENDVRVNKIDFTELEKNVDEIVSSSKEIYEIHKDELKEFKTSKVDINFNNEQNYEVDKVDFDIQGSKKEEISEEDIVEVDEPLNEAEELNDEDINTKDDISFEEDVNFDEIGSSPDELYKKDKNETETLPTDKQKSPMKV